MQDPRNNRKFEYRVEVIGVDSAEQTITRSFDNKFDWMNAKWQMCSVPVDLSEFASITSITVTFDYSYNTGSVLITTPKLQIGEFTYYEYVEGTELIGREHGSSKYEVTYEYNNDKLCVKKIVVNTQAEENEQTVFETKYVYNKDNKLVKTINWDGIIEENIYNDKGVIIENQTYHKDDPSTILSSKKKLDENGDETEILDEFGDTVQKSEYDHNNRLITSEDKKLNRTSTGYNFDGDEISLTSSSDGVQNKNNSIYTNGVLTKVSHNDFDVEYEYDTKLRPTLIKVGGQEYTEYQYTGNVTHINLPNDEYKEITTDRDGKICSEKYVAQNVGKNKNMLYNETNDIIYILDEIANEKTDFEYDNFGRTKKKIVKNNLTNAQKLYIENTFDLDDNITNANITFGNSTQNYLFEYSKNLSRKLLNTTLSNVFVQNLSYDLLGRTKQIKTTFGQNVYTKQYSYLTKGNKTSNYIAAEWFGLNGLNKASIHYTYDNNGNITNVKNNGEVVAQYEYDGLNRIVRENNKKFNFTKTFEYDAGGNIVGERKYYFTIHTLDDESPVEVKKYFYKSEGWRDQLMGYSVKTINYTTGEETYNERTMNYDRLGNPTTYKGNPMSWTRGRCLKSYNDNNFEYNADGIRTKKNDISYILNGTKILSQSDGINTLVFQYGSNGVEGFTLNGDQYVYQKNILGDIIGIFDSNQQLVAKYAYDAWGNCNILFDNTPQSMYNDTISNINPFRYRGYYFDIETGFYYLNSRYYDPSICRFINADDISYANANLLNGLNLYAYCGNNPIKNIDHTGTSWWTDFWKSVGNFFASTWDVVIGTVSSIGLVVGGLLLTIFTSGALAVVGGTLIGAGVGGFIGGIQSKLTGGSYWGGYLGGAISGGLTGLGAFFGPVGVFIGGALGNFAGSIVTCSINEIGLNGADYWLNLIADSLLSGVIAIASFGFGNLTASLNIPGFRDIFAAIKIWAEFAFSYVFDETKKILRELAETLRRGLLSH